MTWDRLYPALAFGCVMGLVAFLVAYISWRRKKRKMSGKPAEGPGRPDDIKNSVDRKINASKTADEVRKDAEENPRRGTSMNG